jgi:hypothetical protein
MEFQPMKKQNLVFFLVCLILSFGAVTAQEQPKPGEKWYVTMPSKAVPSADGSSMTIGNKTYRVDNAFDPIAPKGGERIIDSAGVLPYYMWVHRIPGSTFTVSRIDEDGNIYYLDGETGKYTSPDGLVMVE